MTYRGKVTTGDGILKELYEISARYQARGRPDPAEIPAERAYCCGALIVWLETAYVHIDSLSGDDSVTPDQMRSALLEVATGAITWAREIREQNP